MKILKRTLIVILCGVMMLSAVVPALAAADIDLSRPVNAHLTFGDDDKLTILQITDIQDDETLSCLAKAAIRRAIKEVQPDLIVLTGDNISGPSCKTKLEATIALKSVMKVLDPFGIPVAAVFGNHDDESTPLTKFDQMEIYESYGCFIGCAGVVAEKTVGENTMTNVGTYNIPVFESEDSDKVIYNIWCFDSGNYNPDDTYGSYGYVLPEQLDWYVEKSNELKAANGGEVVPSIAFQHIIPPQIFGILKEVEPGTPGAIEKNGKYYVLPDDIDPQTNWLSEAPCPPSVYFEPGYAELETMLGQGDVQAVFVGHDHINAYSVPYNGINLVCSPSCGFYAYNDEHGGFRVITVDKDDTSSYDTYTILTSDLFKGNIFLTICFDIHAFIRKAGDFFEDLGDRISDYFNNR